MTVPLASALCWAVPARAQVAVPPPVSAGTLLEQQRRTPPAEKPEAKDPLSLPTRAVEPASPAAASSLAPTVVRAFDVRGNTLVDSADVQAALAPWIDRPVDMPGLRAAAAAVEGLYRRRHLLARVVLPNQDITAGTVQLNVVEARVGRVVIDQGDVPVGAALTGRVRSMLEGALPAGEPLDLTRLERALLIADDLPGVRVKGALRAGEAIGSTDLAVTLRRGPAIGGQVNVDNGGNRATGSERATVQLNLLSPLGQGEDVSLLGSISRGSQYVSLGISAPLPGAMGDDGWRLGATVNALHYKVLDARNTTPGLAPEGGSTGFGASLTYPVVRTAVSNLLVSIGYTHTRLTNRDDDQVLDVLITVSRARSNSLVAGLSGYRFDRLLAGGVTSGGVVLTAGHLDLSGSSANYITSDALTASTQGGFAKVRWNVSRLQTLVTNLSILGVATGQFATANLDPSEKMYLGGISGVRAYPNAEAGGSTGVQASLDLRFDLDPRLQISGFYDWGQVGQYYRNAFAGTALPLVANNRVTLQGAGAGISWRSAQGLRIQGVWARRIGHNPLATAAGTDTDGSLRKDRFWLNAGFAF